MGSTRAGIAAIGGSRRWLLVITAVAMLATSTGLFAHGERAQQAGTRMRTINWYDISVTPANPAVGDEVVVSGRFRTSAWWPEHIASVTGKTFLNVGTSGPNFIRVHSSIDGVSMVQSTALELGRDYGFEIVLRARRPGRFHVHPIVSVEDAGGMVGPGRWVEVSGSQADFDNRVTTMFGRELELEHMNLATIGVWHGIWFLLGGAWLAYWLRRRPLLVPRFRAVAEAEKRDGDGDAVLTDTDRKVAVGFLVVTLLLIVGGFQWAERRYPVTTPLRTAKITMPSKAPATSTVAVSLTAARYRIPGRSFAMDLEVTNGSERALEVAEFTTANVRFINPAVKAVQPLDSHDLVAPDGLRVEGGAIAPGETRAMTVYAEDALWETQRLTHMINDPDSVIAGLMFFEDAAGGREIVEIGGTMVPVFR